MSGHATAGKGMSVLNGGSDSVGGALPSPAGGVIGQAGALGNDGGADYEAHGGQGGAARVDECAMGLHDCDANAECSDKPESFACTCKDGYFGDGTSCTCRQPSLGNVLTSPGFDKPSNASGWMPSPVS